MNVLMKNRIMVRRHLYCNYLPEPHVYFLKLARVLTSSSQVCVIVITFIGEIYRHQSRGLLWEKLDSIRHGALSLLRSVIKIYTTAVLAHT